VNARRSPTIRRRRLGAELRRHRETAGVTIDVVAERLGFSPSKVSRIETGHNSASPRDVADLLSLYGVETREAAELVQIAREARQKGWWHPYSAVLVGAYVGLEAAARGVRAYEQQVIPGLLQSEEYALAMIRAARSSDTPREIDRRVHVRLARQSLLIQDDPIDLHVVLDQAVLSRPVGGDDVMRDQLSRLIEAQELPNVTLQILPFTVGAHAAMDGAFAILDFSDSADADVVYAENATGGLFLEKEEELRKYYSIFDALVSAALSPEESARMLELSLEEPLWRSRPRDSGST
jgi:transcriptional regulator with XRE-family HTH domain